MFLFRLSLDFPSGSSVLVSHQLPSDKLDTAKKEVEHITPADAMREEEYRLRNALAPAPADAQPSDPWFATNVVDHRYVRSIINCLCWA